MAPKSSASGAILRPALGAAFAMLLASAPPVAAMQVRAGAGWSSEPGRATRSALGALTLGSDSRGLTLAGLSYDDDVLGTGFGLTGAAGTNVLSSFLAVRGSATRYQGQDGFGAWRVRAGPEARLPTGQRLRVYAMHYAGNFDESADGMQFEVETPIFPLFTGYGSYSTESWSDGLHTQEVSAGLGLSLLSHLALLGELGVARNSRTTPADPAPDPRRGLMPPLLGDGGPEPGISTTGDGVSGMIRMGVRVTLP